jgi:hypothetical protein
MLRGSGVGATVSNGGTIPALRSHLDEPRKRYRAPTLAAENRAAGLGELGIEHRGCCFWQVRHIRPGVVRVPYEVPASQQRARIGDAARPRGSSGGAVSRPHPHSLYAWLSRTPASENACRIAAWSQTLCGCSLRLPAIQVVAVENTYARCGERMGQKWCCRVGAAAKARNSSVVRTAIGFINARPHWL